MREVITPIYEVSELSPQAFNRAFNQWLECDPYDRGRDNESTLDRFSELFNVRVTSWSYGGNNRHVRFSTYGLDEYDYSDVSGERLRRWVINNYHSRVHEGKYYSKLVYSGDKPTYKKRYSKVIQSRDCILTGYYLDMAILQPIYDFMDYKRNFETYDELIKACLEAWLDACEADYEDMTSERAFREEAEANDYEFYEDGTRY